MSLSLVTPVLDYHSTSICNIVSTWYVHRERIFREPVWGCWRSRTYDRSTSLPWMDEDEDDSRAAGRCETLGHLHVVVVREHQYDGRLDPNESRWDAGIDRLTLISQILRVDQCPFPLDTGSRLCVHSSQRGIFSCGQFGRDLLCIDDIATESPFYWIWLCRFGGFDEEGNGCSSAMLIDILSIARQWSLETRILGLSRRSARNCVSKWSSRRVENEKESS